MRNQRRLWMIVGLLVFVALWVGSGVLFRDEAPAKTDDTTSQSDITTVAVRRSQAEPIERLLVLQGEMQPDQVVTVQAETAGEIQSWEVARGAEVEQGDLLAVIELGERQSQLQQAKARVEVARHQLEATRQLAEDGYEPDIDVDVAEAELDAAQADLAAIEQDIDRTRIRAPIPGRINQRHAEQGDYVASGGDVAQLVNNDPLLATVQVRQHRVEDLRIGLPAQVRMIGHGRAAGRVTYISSLADPTTRTFQVQIKIDNPDGALPAGTSVEAEIPIAEVMAHQVSPALVSLNDEGLIGVKTVNDEGVVEFHPCEVVRAERDGLWVTGLPKNARIITVGQGFVSAGESVRARDEDALGTSSTGDRPASKTREAAP